MNGALRRSLCRSAAVVLALIMAITFAFGTTDTYAASKNVKSTVYINTLKSGNIVYCTNAHRVFRVNLKTESVKVLATSKVGYTGNLKLKGGYLYYMETSQYGGGCRIYRIHLKSGKKKLLAKNTGPTYAFRGKRIYYHYAKETSNGIKLKKRVMKLNGKSKKSTKYKVKMKQKLTNASGYLVENTYWDARDYEYIDYYLRTPYGDIFLESYYPII